MTKMTKMWRSIRDLVERCKSNGVDPLHGVRKKAGSSSRPIQLL
jgi:hypothetical protein